MSTNSKIYAKVKNNEVKVIYCHFDGYLSGVGKTLELHFSDHQKVKNLMDLGNLSVLCSNIDKPKGHSFDDPIKGYTIAYGRDRGETGQAARSYTSFKEAYKKEHDYLYNYYWDGDQWYIYDKKDEFLKSLR